MNCLSFGSMKYLLGAVIVMFLQSCSSPKSGEADSSPKVVDLIVLNANIYTVDGSMAKAEAIAVHSGEIEFVGTSEEVRNKYTSNKTIDADGMAMYPGFVDAHCHFLGYARTLLNVDLVGTSSKEEVLAKTINFFDEDYQGWVKGRGWDHTDWEVKEFPNKEDLDELYPDVPVALRRVDGHALWANTKALELAGISSTTKVDGGDVMLGEDGEPNGILLDNAADLVLNIIPENVKEYDEEVVQRAQGNCLEVGLTSMHDAGLPLDDVLFLKKQYEEGKIHFRLYQMISHEEDAVAYFEENGAIETDLFTVKAVKCYMDGALGSRGALLKSEYHDASQRLGLQLTTDSAMENIVARCLAMGFQVNTHSIGDGAVAKTLGFYGSVLPEGNDLRWRVEHSQVVDPNDLTLYRKFNIIPSVQPTHCTSDMYWVPDRLGEERAASAYAYKDLLATNGWICAGSDFPVESINPLFGFYAAVSRMDQEGFPEGGFQMENALSREEALKAMTIWAAKAAFREDDYGSIEVGKSADFVLLDRDIMTVPINEVFEAKVQKTFIRGEQLYSALNER